MPACRALMEVDDLRGSSDGTLVLTPDGRIQVHRQQKAHLKRLCGNPQDWRTTRCVAGNSDRLVSTMLIRCPIGTIVAMSFNQTQQTKPLACFVSAQ